VQIPTQITFKNLPHSEALERRVRELVDKLERINDRITRCDVVIEKSAQRFHVRLRLTTPGGEIDVTHDPGEDGAHEDPYVAVRDTFLAARRALNESAGATQARRTTARPGRSAPSPRPRARRTTSRSAPARR